MSAGTWNPVMEANGAFRRVVTLSLGDPPVAWILTGYSARMWLQEKTRDGAGAILLQLSSTGTTPKGSGLTIDGSAGTVTVFISDGDAWDLRTPGQTRPVAFDLVLVPPNSEDIPVLSGTIKIKPGVTQPA